MDPNQDKAGSLEPQLGISFHPSTPIPTAAFRALTSVSLQSRTKFVSWALNVVDPTSIMDISTQESASKVPADPASPLNKEGKREAEDDAVKQSVNAKKQKVGEEVAEIKEGEDIVKWQVETSLEVDCALESERQIEVKIPPAKNGNLGVALEDERAGLAEDDNAPKKTVAIVGKNGDVASSEKDGTSGNHSSLEDVSSKEDVPATRKSPSAPINPVPLITSKKQNESRGDPEYEEQISSGYGIGDLKQASALVTEKGPVAVVQEKDKSSSNHLDSEGKTGLDEDVCDAKKASTSSIEDAPVTEAMTKAVSSSDLENGTGDNEAPWKKEIKTLLSGTLDVLKSSSQAAQRDSSSALGESHDEYVPLEGQELKKTVSENSCSSEKASEDEALSKEEEEKSNKTAKKNDSDVEMTDVPKAEGFSPPEKTDSDAEMTNVPKTEENAEEGCSPVVKTDSEVEMNDVSKTEGNVEEGGAPVEKTPEPPSTPKDQRMGSKTVFVGNLSFSVEQEDVENFFQPAGEIAGIRFAMNSDETFRGHGYVEFTSAEAAEKAVRELNGRELLRRRVRLDLARERRSQMPCGSGKDGRTQGQTIFVRGFNKDDDAEQIRSSLEQHFGSCGEITKVCVPKDQDGRPKGIAYIDFKDTDTCNRALELNGSDFRGNALSVEEARPKIDHHDGAGGGWGGGRWGGRSGWGFGGRFSGGREFGGRYGSGREYGGRFCGGREFGGRYGSTREFGGRYGGRFGGDREFGGSYGGDREFGGRYSGDRENGGRYGGDREFGGRYGSNREFGGRYGSDREFGGRFYGDRQFGGGRGFGGRFGGSWELGGSHGRGFVGRGRGTPSEPSAAAAGTGMNRTSNDAE